MQQHRSLLFGNREEKILSFINESPYKKELDFLYDTMPLSDVGNYPPELFEAFAAHGRWLRENISWCKALPEELYKNEVLYHRVNDEELCDCRRAFCDILLPLVEGLSMEEAAKRINYWCLEEATYKLTDERTVSPLTMLRCAFGRCGEESTFTVTALRSVGIPARQVYSPKWPHCDDNHAWVELFCDGEWKYMGACEPEESLNRGWFSAAASRAMLVHSRSFGLKGSYNSGEYISHEGCMSLWNQLPRYADTVEMLVKITENGQPLEDVLVKSELLNYAQFSPIAKQLTDKNGEIRLRLGLGDLRLHCVKDGRFITRFVDLRKENIITLDFGEAVNFENEELNGLDFNMEPPKDNMDYLRPQEEKVKLLRQEKFDAAIAKRHAKEEHNWLTYKAAEAKAIELGYGEEAKRAAALLAKTFGNEKEILAFLAPTENRELRIALLESLSEKDLTDCRAELLENSLTASLPYEKDYPRDVFVSDLLSPRIGMEILTDWRDLKNNFSEKEIAACYKSPRDFGKWLMEQISYYPEEEYETLITCPKAIFDFGCGSPQSRNIHFVAACRSIGIAARLAPDDGRPQYWDKEATAFRDGIPSNREELHSFTINSEESEPWLYTQNWTLSRLERGEYITLDLSRESWQDGKLNLNLPEAHYRLITCKRMPTGALFAKEYRFHVGVGEKDTISISQRSAKLTDLLSDKPIPDFQLYEADGSPVSMKAACGERANLLLWLEEGKEPTEHILNELYDLRDGFNELNAQIIFVLKSEAALKDNRIARALAELPQIRILYDDFRDTMSMLARRMYIDPDKLPIVVLCSRGLNGIYGSSGYNVGLGDLILKIFGEL